MPARLHVDLPELFVADLFASVISRCHHTPVIGSAQLRQPPGKSSWPRVILPLYECRPPEARTGKK